MLSAWKSQIVTCKKKTKTKKPFLLGCLATGGEDGSLQWGSSAPHLGQRERESDSRAA